MPCRESLRMSAPASGEFLNPEKLKELLRGSEKLLLIDCRCQSDYVRSHIKGAINVTLPTLMQKRLRKGTLNIASVIHNQDAKERFSKGCKTHLIVLYDECSTDLNANPSSIINLMLKKLAADGCKAAFLLGGFSTFEERCPEFCMSQDYVDSSILGLRNLRISEDSAYGTSDSDCENTPNHYSPFPVKVLSHLYLGNAKNSADLSGLKKHGIYYILNVTPNVPNAFEKDENFHYMQIPISDHWSQNLAEHFPRAIAFIDEARKNGKGVLVHCLAGISRSVTVTVAYLMGTEGMSLNEAYDFVKSCKPNISPNFNFMGQLMEFEKTLHRGDNSSSDSDDNGIASSPGQDSLLQTSPDNRPT